MIVTPGRLASAALITAAIFGGSVVRAAGSDGSVDSPVDAGAVVIADAVTMSSELTSGDSNSAFVLVVPDDAACPGDTFHDDWRVQSFIIPASDNPGDLRYGEIWPEGEGRYSVYRTDTRPFVHMSTMKAAGPGEPGPVDQAGPLTFAVFTPGTLPAGNYRIGLACTFNRETATFWDSEIVVADAPEVEPGQFTWRLAAVPEGTVVVDDSGSGNWAVVLGGLGVFVVLAGIFFLRRPSRAHSPTKEQI